MTHSFHFILSNEDMLPLHHIQVDVTDQDGAPLDSAILVIFKALGVDESRLQEFDSMFNFIKFEPVIKSEKFG